MKKSTAVLVAVLAVAMLTTVAFATTGDTTITTTDINGILGAMTGQISVSSIMTVLVAAVGAAIGFVFMWWGVRKLMSTFFSGFRKGRASV